ncbi:MAG: gamma-glutamyltransferase family protein [Candidatus Limnocylindria bacterium]
MPVPLVRGSHGAVVAPHHLATAAGLHVLRQGGSAVDAAVATNAVLAVVMPSGCGIGGDAFWLIWDEAARVQHAINGSGRAPAAADPTALRARGLRAIPRRGPLSITVPGAVRSWGDAHARFGRLSRDAILGPAIELAAAGFPAWDGFIDAVEATSPLVHEAIGAQAGFFAVYRPHGRPWRPGERVRLPALAATLERIARDGFDTIYDGDLGERQAAGLAAAGSAIDAADLRAHRSTFEPPIGIDYRAVRVTTHPPNSSGVVALEILGILERVGRPDRDAFGPDGVTDPAWIHAGLEASRLAMADRDAWLTDPAVRDVPVTMLLDPDRLAELAARIDPGRVLPAPPAANPPGGGTIYLAVVDDAGNAVSLIESNYLGFGSGVVDPATGIHYQDRGSYFSLDPAHPNVLAPGKRTLHTLLPGMLLRDAGDGRGLAPWIVAGSMGGDAQPQIHAQFVSAVVDGGLDIRTAVAMPRWYVEPRAHFEPPVDVHLEPRHAPAIADTLTALGHRLVPTVAFDSDLGQQHAIELVDGGPAAPDGSVAATTDPRSAGLPAAW